MIQKNDLKSINQLASKGTTLHFAASLIHFRLLSVELTPRRLTFILKVAVKCDSKKVSISTAILCHENSLTEEKCINNSALFFAYFQLQKKAKLNKYVKLIGLPKKDPKSPALVNCLVAGWGITAGNKLEPSPVLKETTEKLQFNNECKHIWKSHFNSQHMICTKFNKNKGGICQVKMIGMKH